VPLGVVLFLIACLISGSLGWITKFSLSALFCFAMAGLSHFILGRYCNYRAIAAIGTNLANPIQQWEVIVTLTLAIVLLGEHLTTISVIAIALLVLGPAVAIRGGGEDRGGGPSVDEAPASQLKFQPRYAEGYTWAFLSIFGYGSSPIFVRAGLEGAGIQASLAAGLVSYITAAVILGAWALIGRQSKHIMTLERGPGRWFLLAGTLLFFSHMVRYMALALIPVTIVAPILRIQSLFRIYFSWLITRDYEVFGRGVILGTIVSVAGAALITLQPQVLASLFPSMPDWLHTALAWRWP